MIIKKIFISITASSIILNAAEVLPKIDPTNNIAVFTKKPKTAIEKAKERLRQRRTQEAIQNNNPAIPQEPQMNMPEHMPNNNPAIPQEPQMNMPEHMPNNNQAISQGPQMNMPEHMPNNNQAISQGPQMNMPEHMPNNNQAIHKAPKIKPREHMPNNNQAISQGPQMNMPENMPNNNQAIHKAPKIKPREHMKNNNKTTKPHKELSAIEKEKLRIKQKREEKEKKLKAIDIDAAPNKFNAVKKLLLSQETIQKEQKQEKAIEEYSNIKKEYEEEMAKYKKALQEYEQKKKSFINMKKEKAQSLLLPQPISSMSIGNKRIVYAKYYEKTLKNLSIIDYDTPPILPELEKPSIEKIKSRKKDTGITIPKIDGSVNLNKIPKTAGAKIPNPPSSSTLDVSSGLKDENDFNKYKEEGRFEYKEKKIKLSIGDEFYGWRVEKIKSNYVEYKNLKTNQIIKKYY